MIGQRDVMPDSNGNPPIRYDAVSSCLEKVSRFASQNNSSVHMPRIGCGLAGGNWENIEPIIVKNLASKGIHTTVYDFS